MLRIQEIREIIKLIDNSSIDEFTYETRETTVIIKKSDQKGATSVKEEVLVSEKIKTSESLPGSELPQQASAQKPTEVIDPSEGENISEITSPMVGTFYQAPSPDSEPYVQIGSKVQEDTIVCIVEAMKLFNEIEAEVCGEIIEILVEDGELVEYGQPLFKVKTS